MFSIESFKKSLQSELNTFFGSQIGSAPPTKSAFSQARKKLHDTFYESLFYQTVSSFEAHAVPKKFKGYHLIACDTTVQKLPDNADTRCIGIHKNQHQSVASTKILTYHDVINCITIYANINNKQTSDIHCAKAVIGGLCKEGIYIYDRGFASHLIPYLHAKAGSKFVIRLTIEQFNSAKKLAQSADNEAFITEEIQYRAFKELKKMGISVGFKDKLTYRLVKIPLSTGETEILMTNLDETITIEDLAGIYHQRWGVETSYNYFKNTFMLGTFSGYSVVAVKQDIWCVLINYNLQTIIQYDCEQALEIINKKRKAEYKINRNVGAGTLRNHLKDIFLNGIKKCEQALIHIQNLFLKSLEKIKPTHKERLRKRLRQNDRHQTELNYKRGF